MEIILSNFVIVGTLDIIIEAFKSFCANKLLSFIMFTPFPPENSE